jgi:hypothetical protein
VAEVQHIERKEERSISSDPLLISLSSTATVLARLLNVSRNGFCITHQYPAFVVGQEVRARAPWADVPARVVWVGEQNGAMVTGFRTDRAANADSVAV